MGSNQRAVLTTLVQDAVLKLCTQHIKFDVSLEIDGIICITPGDVNKEIVIKMHRTIMKSASEEAQWQGNAQYQGDVTTSAASSSGNPVPQPITAKLVDPDSFSTAVRSNVSFDEIPPDSLKVEQGGYGQSYDTSSFESTNQTHFDLAGHKRKSAPTADTSHHSDKYIKVEPDSDIMLEEDSMSYATITPSSESTNDANYNMSQEGDDLQCTTSTDFNIHSGTGKTPRKSPFSSLGTLFTEFSQISPCEACNNVFPTPRCLEYHTTIVHNGFCENCNKRIDFEANPTEHARAHFDTSNKKFQCQHCYKLFGSEMGLTSHLDPHMKCNLCGKILNKPQRSGHLKNVHGWKK